MDRREGAEERDERGVAPDELAVGVERASGELVHAPSRARGRLGARDVRERRNEGRGERRLEVPVREAGQAVLEGDRLALLGHAEPAGRVPRRLREDRRVRGAAAAPGAAAAAVEDRQLDAAARGERGELLLRAPDRPLRRQVAAVLARVRVADHHLEAAVRRDATVVEQLVDDARRRLEVGDRLEERNDRQGLVGEVEHARHVACRGGARHDHGVERTRAVARPGARDGGEGLAHALVGLRDVARVEPHVEPGDVEPEELDARAQPREPAVREALAAVRAEAPVDHVEIRGELVRRGVAVVPEPPPDERELAAVRLALVLPAERRRDLGELALVARDRLAELARRADQRRREPERHRERPHLGAQAREREVARALECGRDRLGACRRVPVLVAADPRAEAGAGRARRGSGGGSPRRAAAPRRRGSARRTRGRCGSRRRRAAAARAPRRSARASSPPPRAAPRPRRASECRCRARAGARSRACGRRGSCGAPPRSGAPSGRARARSVARPRRGAAAPRGARAPRRATRAVRARTAGGGAAGGAAPRCSRAGSRARTRAGPAPGGRGRARGRPRAGARAARPSARRARAPGSAPRPRAGPRRPAPRAPGPGCPRGAGRPGGAARWSPRPDATPRCPAERLPRPAPSRSTRPGPCRRDRGCRAGRRRPDPRRAP